MPVPRIVALDIDGTLISSTKQILDFTRSEIHRVVAEHGARIVLVTARGPESTAVVEERLGVPASFVTYGGALVQQRTADGLRDVAETPIPRDEVLALAAAAREAGAHLGLYARDEWIVSDVDYWALREARNTAVWPSERTVDELLAADEPVFKVMLRGAAPVIADAAARARGLALPLFVHAGREIIEVFSEGAVKLRALALLGAAAGFRLDEVIAFGDTESDAAMLGASGVGVLMGNARPDLEVAPQVIRTLSNDEDGIGVMLRRQFPTARPFRP
ncbi:MAG: HAD-IIB family hydrolase [Microbacteriaceae bacterium]|nr:HAD-IIB family hydrolase [Microbacteriaceae bacterium]